MNKTIPNYKSLPVIFVALVAVFVLLVVYLYPLKRNTNQTLGYFPPETSVNSGDGILDDFKISIEKIGVVAPVIPDVDGSNKEAYINALYEGIAHYRGTAYPEEGSNVFLFGHSSSAIGSGDYKEIFKDLGELEFGDKIKLTYLGKNLDYTVSEKRVVENTEVSVLDSTDEEQLTLMTCWPIGTNNKRLIVIAKP